MVADKHGSGRMAVVIFGASGDLTSRKIAPALHSLKCSGLLPETEVIGVGRSGLTDEEFKGRLYRGIAKFSRLKPDDCKAWPAFSKRFSYLSGPYNEPETYRRLRKKLKDEGDGAGSHVNCLFYLATPPELFPVIAEQLGKAGLNQSRSSWKRIIIEKPFGRDGTTARRLDRKIHAVFREGQVFRIDHYLGKETVQNILTLRFANAIFEPLWTRSYIDHVQITVAEDVGVEHRAGYYEKAGVVRDIVQNHILQLVSLVGMEPPSTFSATAIRDEKAKLLKAVRPPLAKDAVLGQYRGYCSEPGVAKDSRTATFVALKIFVDNWRWQGVPFYLRTGKRLAKKVTEVALKFKSVPLLLFPGDKDISPNRISLCIQPDEGLHLRFETRAPGMGMKTTPANMAFHYGRFGANVLPEAYERLILDAVHGDPTLFAREDEIELAWGIVGPLLRDGEGRRGARPPALYDAGSWGPSESEGILRRDGRSWELSCSTEGPVAAKRPGRHASRRANW